MTAFVAVESVCKSYGAVRALRDVSVAVERGAMCAIVGPSGSGKTTLLSLLGALDRPTSGRVRVAGVDLATLGGRAVARFRQGNVGLVFQSYHLVPVLTAAENIALPLGLQGIPGAARRRRVEALLEELGLRHVAGHRPAELSGGQQQRVAIARALVTEPQLVLADEPTAHLDAETTREVMVVLRRVHAARGATFLFSTHDPAVEAAAHVLVHLRSGAIVHEATRKEGRAPCRSFCASHCATYAAIHAGP